MKMSISIPDELWFEARSYAPNKSKSVIFRLALQDFLATCKQRFFLTIGADEQGYIVRFKK